jgi:outer membrane lipoprotein-sorting protein
MTTRPLTVLVALLAWPSLALADDAMTGQQILDKTLEHNRVGFDAGQATLVMRIKTPRGDIVENKLLTRAARVDGLIRTRMTFIEPQDQRGIEVLLLQQKGDRDLQYLYLPRFKTSRRISGAAKNGRFQGSDFTYADLESRDVKEGASTRLPDTTYGKQPVYRVDVIPKASDDEQYAKVEMWISQTTWIPLKTIFYDRAGKQLKVLKIKRIKKVDGRWIPTSLVMANVQGHSETALEIESINTNARFPDSLFSQASLGK